MKIVMCASEVVPFAKTGGLADVVGALPTALEEKGADVIVIMPYYKAVHNVKIDARLNKGVTRAVIGKNIKVYFIENELYFSRDGLYGDKFGDYKDNLARFSYYCKKSLALLKEINFCPDIIHCHDWQTALIPVYLKTVYSKDSFYKNAKSIFTIHNLGYQGIFSEEEFSLTGLDKSLFHMDKLEFHGKMNLLKGGIIFSDYVTTVSPTYSKEIQSKELGFGLEGVLAKRKDCLLGILNGIDYSIWNPQTDKVIARNYSISDLRGKEKDKEALQEICGLPKNADIPLLGMVTRLVDHKGLDILAPELDSICKLGLQLVILGKGDLKFHSLFENAAKRYPKTLSLHLKFDDMLAHKIYAGSDIFLMPSQYEPCGLGQLISLRYGAVPLVYKTGGLADTVTREHGFVFEYYKKEELFKTVKEAVETFADKDAWARLVVNAMKCDFSWEESAKEYVKVYKKIVSSNN